MSNTHANNAQLIAAVWSVGEDYHVRTHGGGVYRLECRRHLAQPGCVSEPQVGEDVDQMPAEWGVCFLYRSELRTLTMTLAEPACSTLQPPAAPAPTKLICPKCSGDNVGYEANAVWNVALQCEELGSTFDQGWCNDCGDVEPARVPVSQEEHAEALRLAAQADTHPALVALRKVLARARTREEVLADEEQEDGPQPPSGDDYNDLVGWLDAAAREAGLPALIRP